MKDSTYKKLVEKDLAFQDFENLENICNGFLFNVNDDMIIKIMEFYNKK